MLNNILKIAAKYNFPLKPFLVNGIALWLMSAVIYKQYLFEYFTFKQKEDWTFFFFLLALFLVVATFHAALYFGLSLIPQLILFYFFKAKIRKKLWWWIIFLSPFVILGSCHLYLATPTARARTILANANMASLPKSAQDIYVHTWSSFMSGAEYLRFHAEPDDIEQFIDNSPILKDVKYDIFKKDKMRLYQPKNYPYNLDDVNSSYEYIVPRPCPDWYKEEIKGAGKRYEIQPEGYHYPGEVIIDNENNIVYVKLVFS